jgi:hypothetical protein
MVDQSNRSRRVFPYIVHLMKNEDVARHCDLMGWTSDPVIAVLVERLLEADKPLKIVQENESSDIENAWVKGWGQCILDTLEMAEKSQSELKDCARCNASDVLDMLMQDIESAVCPDPPDGGGSSGGKLTVRTENVRTVKKFPRSKRKSGPEPNILLSIKSVLEQAEAPMKSADLIQAVLNENTSALKEGSIRNAITKAVEEQAVRKLGRGLYCLPNSGFS